MAEELIISKGSRQDAYECLLPQITALISDETNVIANLANVSAALRQSFNFFWVGFYVVDSETELVLGPFQGDIACTRIKKGQGVCGTAWKEEKTIIVPNVDEFPGHITCSSLSKSEIVVPIFVNNFVKYILDIDSHLLNDFNETDSVYLEQLAKIISKQC
ncbi:MAG TPA: GAF domain-containing protein [Crocinitomix sp.]|nr:GAF domain-containing protein [Crocinitomix sp.]